MKKICTVAICLLCSFKIFAQTDTSFWFVAPEVTSTHGDRPIFLRFTSLDKPATIVVSQPANSSFAPITISLNANSSRTLDLTSSIDIIENKPADQKLKYGIYIRSSAFITAYYETGRTNNTDIFSLKGRNALGKSFMIPSQNIMDNVVFTPPANSSFDIVATENNTTVTITPKNGITGHQAGVPFTIVLNKGETYSAVASGLTGNQHLMGSVVTADKPIAITVKDDSITGGGYGGCYDIGGDQIVPLNLIGTKYITLPGYLNIPLGQPTDNIFILGTEDNTDIYVNGALTRNVQKGETFLQKSYNNVFYIETSKPTYVFQLSGFGCEVAEALLPQIECTGSKTVGFTRATTEPLFMNILVPKGGEAGFTFNGNTSTINSSQFTDVSNTNGAWKYARIQLSTAQLAAGAAAIVKNNLQAFQLSIIHGDAQTGCRYGYFSDYNSLTAVAGSNTPLNGSLCTGQDLNLTCDVGATNDVTFQWNGPQGFSSTDQNPVLGNAIPAYSGIYTCIATKAGCKIDTTSITVLVSDIPVSTVTAPDSLCAGQLLQLNATDAGAGVTYNWSGPAGFSSTLRNPSFTAFGKNTGQYNVTIARNSCIIKDSVTIRVDVNPGAHPFTASPFCTGDSIVLDTPIPAWALDNTAAFSWLGPNGFTSNKQRNVLYNADLSLTGQYTLTVNAPACGDSVGSVQVTVNPIPQAQATISNTACTNTILTLNAATTLPGTSYNWKGPNNLNSNQQNIIINQPATAATGTYILTTSLLNCSSADTVNTIVYQAPDASISAKVFGCVDQLFQFTNNNTAPNSFYAWSGPNNFSSTQQSPSITSANYADAGRFILTITANGCIDSDSLDVSINPSPVVVFTPVQNICLEKPGFTINTATETSGINGAGEFTGEGVSSIGYFSPTTAGIGTHTIRYTYTAFNGCISYAEQPITVYPTPSANAGEDQVIIEGSSIILSPITTGDIKTYAWAPITGLNNSGAQQPVASPKLDITYTLTVTTTDDCTATDAIYIRVLKKIGIPNAFSPNGDGINDKWQLDGLYSFAAAKLEVFNRNGQIVFSTTGYPTPWDGTYNNKPLPTGTYYYVLHLNDGYRKEPISGWVQLLR
ncbi:T9SS type B sorting domain-containing protein [Limnovirga soli]|uniref:T9SS type B sorting domain-containing protein n=1 Tax=Limnovirga soli TaxID=2656915 RepID=A0A8J8JUE6_9BACT|nr:gliding motility-associated C-terminal domain-containing protein [Limnovirga soli]NNV56225.1 T9SS type B sorting domain-containing protein [Limnovirga soli]